MDLQRAKAISEVAQTIINSAKVEVEYAKALGESPGGVFFGALEAGERKPLPIPAPRRLA